MASRGVSPAHVSPRAPVTPRSARCRRLPHGDRDEAQGVHAGPPRRMCVHRLLDGREQRLGPAGRRGAEHGHDNCGAGPVTGDVGGDEARRSVYKGGKQFGFIRKSC